MGPAQWLVQGDVEFSIRYFNYITTMEQKYYYSQESPPAWTQEAYRPLHSKCSLWWWGITQSSNGGGIPHPVMMGGTSSSHGWEGYPIQSWWGGVPPIQSWPGMGYPPPSDLGRGTPPPPLDLGQDNPPPPPIVNRQTFPSIIITFFRTTYAGGNKTKTYIALITHIYIRHEICCFMIFNDRHCGSE